VDFDRSINFAINQIRGALDDDPRNPRYIETLPRKGYRFIAPVSATYQGSDRAVDVTRSRRWLLLSIGIIALLQQSVAESNRGAIELMYLGHALGVSGARSEAQKVLEEMLRRSHQRYMPPEYIATVYEGLGERDRALHWFQKAYDEHSMNIWMLPDPALDSIRSDPRFKNIMWRMGLPL
jgi:hypothetical protein